MFCILKVKNQNLKDCFVLEYYFIQSQGIGEFTEHGQKTKLFVIHLLQSLKNEYQYVSSRDVEQGEEKQYFQDTNTPDFAIKGGSKSTPSFFP